MQRESLIRCGHPMIFRFLVLANFVSSIFAFRIGNASPFPDAPSYLKMAEGIGQGVFSSWYSLAGAPPETLRMWGYPFFLFLCQAIGGGENLAKAIQLVSHWCAIYICLMFLSRCQVRARSKNLFLAFTALNIQVPYYSGLIATESLTVFMTTVYGVLLMKPLRNFWEALCLAILGSAIFQLRPAFLLFPFLIAGFSLVARYPFKQTGFLFAHAGLFSVLLIPFGIWNYRNHGVFKITPLEGGGYAAYLGNWTYKLPAGFDAGMNHGPFQVSDEFFIFALNQIPNEQRLAYAKEFSEERVRLLQHLSEFESDDERRRVREMLAANQGFPVHNSRYTIEREKQQWSLARRDILKNPLLYLRTRAITFCRNFFTGIDMQAWRESRTLMQVARLMYPFLVTFVSIFLGFVWLSYFFLMRRDLIGEYIHGYWLIAYTAVSNVPFLTQSRYSVPSHLIILLLTVIAIERSVFGPVPFDVEKLKA